VTAQTHDMGACAAWAPARRQSAGLVSDFVWGAGLTLGGHVSPAANPLFEDDGLTLGGHVSPAASPLFEDHGLTLGGHVSPRGALPALCGCMSLERASRPAERACGRVRAPAAGASQWSSCAILCFTGCVQGGHVVWDGHDVQHAYEAAVLCGMAMMCGMQIRRRRAWQGLCALMPPPRYIDHVWGCHEVLNEVLYAALKY